MHDKLAIKPQFVLNCFVFASAVFQVSKAQMCLANSAAPQTATPAVSIESKESLGQHVFKHFCTPCHGPEGGGDGELATSLPLKPRNFKSERLRWGNSLSSVIRTVSGGRSDIMPSFADSLSEQEIKEVSEYVWGLLSEQVRKKGVEKIEFAENQGRQFVIKQKQRKFSPLTPKLNVGDTLIFVNDDIENHNIQLTKNSKIIEQVSVQKTGQWDRLKINDVGEYEIKCAIHPQMKMKLSVKK